MTSIYGSGYVADMPTLADRLRALSRMEHSDHTIGDEAADELERLTAEYEHAVEQAATNADEVLRLRDALELIAAPMRPDGTWNRERLACQQIAVAALKAAP